MLTAASETVNPLPALGADAPRVNARREALARRVLTLAKAAPRRDAHLPMASGIQLVPRRFARGPLLVACLHAGSAYAESGAVNATDKGPLSLAETAVPLAAQDSDASCSRPAQWVNDGPGFVVMEVTRQGCSPALSEPTQGAIWKVIQIFSASAEDLREVLLVVLDSAAAQTTSRPASASNDMALPRPSNEIHQAIRQASNRDSPDACSDGTHAWLVAGVPLKRASGGVTLLVRAEDRIDPDRCPDALASLGPGIIPFKPRSVPSKP